MERFKPVTRALPVEYDPFAGPHLVRTVPTTEAQREVFTASTMGADANCAYVESVSLVLHGLLDRGPLEHALHKLVARHESLRSVLSGTGTRMLVLATVDLQVPFEDLATLSEADRVHRLGELGDQDVSTPFDLVHGPLFRVLLLRTGPAEHILRLSGHHAVLDGWSIGVLMAELSSLYNAELNGGSANLPPPVAFSEYVLAMNAFARSPDQEQVEAWWMEQYQGPVPRLDLPVDRPRPLLKTFHAERLDLPLDPELLDGIRTTATRHGASFVTTLLSIFELLLHKVTGEGTLVVGLPAAGQSDLGRNNLVGHCVNLLALRTEVDVDMRFDTYLKARRSALLDAFDHQRYTFGTLLRKLKAPREPGRIPLVPVVFNIDMNMDDGVAFHGLSHRFVSNPRKYENFELFLNATGSTGKLTLEWSYNTDLFDAGTVRGWMAQFSELARRIVHRPDSTIASLVSDEWDGAAARSPEAAWHGQRTNYPRDRGIGQLFLEMVEAGPERTALELGEQRMSYGELHRRVLVLAAALERAGVQPGHLVGLCTERSPDMVASMLAILWRGAAFVPFDPGYPKERLHFMLADSGVRTVVLQASLADMLPTAGLTNLVLETISEEQVISTAPLCQAGDPAYVMFTSGSTGQPKGVVVPHRAVVRLVRGQSFLPFGPDLTFLQLSNISFDASTLELWGALLNGARLVLQPQQKPTLQEIVATIHKHGVTTAWFTAGLFNLLVDAHLDDLKALRHILCGGDVLSLPHVKRALRALGPGVLINGYGPTENTTFTTTCPINDETDLKLRVPIGYPLHNTTVHVVDEQMRPVATGEKGELLTGGDGLALGYLGRPELTAERFVDDPFSPEPGAKLYRTGDLVRWLPDGSIDFIGRNDGQVKVRGFRVELGEIEHALGEHPQVRDSVAMVRSDLPGEKQVTAYLVPLGLAEMEGQMDAQQAFITAVRDHLRECLPGHMVPTAFMILPELPLTPNGKVDKRRLPAPELRAQTMEVQYLAPRNTTEARLAELWAVTLNVPRMGVHENFFDLGGHSLIGIELLAKVEEAFGEALPLNSLYQAPTVAAFANLLHGKRRLSELENLAPVQPLGDRIPFFCVHGDEANHHISRFLGNDQPYYAFFHQGEEGRPIRYTTVESIAAHYIKELKTLRPDGPYLLGGYSFGGIVAYEMACQLAAEGHQVPLLVMFDMYAPDRFMEVMGAEEPFYQPLKNLVIRSLVKQALRRGKVASPKLRHYYIIDTYHKAIQGYRPKPYGGTVTVFKAEESAGPDDMGWSGLVQGGLDLHLLPGDHYSMIKEPGVVRLVQELSASMDRALRRHEVEAV
jgi:amino acid adenylation domain-containing protein